MLKHQNHEDLIRLIAERETMKVRIAAGENIHPDEILPLLVNDVDYRRGSSAPRLLGPDPAFKLSTYEPLQRQLAKGPIFLPSGQVLKRLPLHSAQRILSWIRRNIRMDGAKPGHVALGKATAVFCESHEEDFYYGFGFRTVEVAEALHALLTRTGHGATQVEEDRTLARLLIGYRFDEIYSRRWSALSVRRGGGWASATEEYEPHNYYLPRWTLLTAMMRLCELERFLHSQNYARLINSDANGVAAKSADAVQGRYAGNPKKAPAVAPLRQMWRSMNSDTFFARGSTYTVGGLGDSPITDYCPTSPIYSPSADLRICDSASAVALLSAQPEALDGRWESLTQVNGISSTNLRVALYEMAQPPVRAHPQEIEFQASIANVDDDQRTTRAQALQELYRVVVAHFHSSSYRRLIRGDENKAANWYAAESVRPKKPKFESIAEAAMVGRPTRFCLGYAGRFLPDSSLTPGANADAVSLRLVDGAKRAGTAPSPDESAIAIRAARALYRIISPVTLDPLQVALRNMYLNGKGKPDSGQ